MEALTGSCCPYVGRLFHVKETEQGKFPLGIPRSFSLADSGSSQVGSQDGVSHARLGLRTWVCLPVLPMKVCPRANSIIYNALH